jgi:hypothetical protein
MPEGGVGPLEISRFGKEESTHVGEKEVRVIKGITKRLGRPTVEEAPPPGPPMRVELPQPPLPLSPLDDVLEGVDEHGEVPVEVGLPIVACSINGDSLWRNDT